MSAACWVGDPPTTFIYETIWALWKSEGPLRVAAAYPSLGGEKNWEEGQYKKACYFLVKNAMKSSSKPCHILRSGQLSVHCAVSS
mmetsp:Transcript_114009/g.213567  ORF Transcript_114009/g.213567 Transcript_114009/m.213567 type:complete len:85 (-) Transcript_114009:120-374(-)